MSFATSAGGFTQPFDLATLRRVHRQPPQQLVRLACCVRFLTRPEVRQREIEARLVEVGVERQRTTEQRDRFQRTTAVGENDAAIRHDNGILGLDSFGLLKRGRCRIESS